MIARFPNAGRIGAAIGTPTGLFGLGFPSLFMQTFQYGKQSNMSMADVILTFAVCGALGGGAGFLAGRGVNFLATRFQKPIADAATKAAGQVTKAKP